jgi:glucokinase
VDVGGTKIAAGVVTFPDGRVQARRRAATAPARGGEAVLAEVLALVADLRADAHALGLSVQAIGVGVCELVDPAGQVMSAQTVAWRGLPVLARLSVQRPAVVEADVRAAALGEALFGQGRRRRCFLYVTAGTGISSCLVLDGQPFAGARGASGTMASSPVGLPCAACGCVSERTVEEIATGPALVARYNERHPGAAQTAEDVLAAAARGDPTALYIIRSAGQALGGAIGALVNVLDPEAVVVGGGLGLSGGLYWEAVTASIRRHIWSDVHRDLPVLPAQTGLDAGLLGAAAAAWRRVRPRE